MLRAPGWEIDNDLHLLEKVVLKQQAPVRIELTTPGLQDQCSSH